MKKLFMLLALLCAYTAGTFAQLGSSCDNAIVIEDGKYEGAIGAGELWFSAETADLPLTIYYYPTDTMVAAPRYYLDLTCVAGVYDDPEVERMVNLAAKYDLEFPMVRELNKMYTKSGQMVYYITFDRNYRDMLYEQGVTYSVPAYLKVESAGDASLSIVSTSINTRCKDYTNSLSINTSLRYAPQDSVNVYLWPIGEWISKDYYLEWEGEEPLEIFTGKDCEVERSSKVYEEFRLKNGEQLQVTTRRSSEWVNDLYQAQMYVRLYTKKEGVLTIKNVDRTLKLISVSFFGIEAPITHEKSGDFDGEINVVLPSGKKRSDAVKSAEVVYESYLGESYSFQERNTLLVIGIYNKDKKVNGTLWYRVNWTDASAAGSTDATLKSIKLDGVEMSEFRAGQLIYDAVEVDKVPVISVETNDVNAKAEVVKTADAVPGQSQIRVTAEAGNELLYELNFVKPRSKDASLSAILLDGKPLAGFTPDEVSYRITVKSVPVVSVVASSDKATVRIQQAKQVPGYAQIEVTAEAGNTQVYTVNMQPDNSATDCMQIAELLDLGQSVELSVGQDVVYRIPIARWDKLENQNIRFSFSGSSAVRMVLASSCMIDDETLIAEYELVPEKGTVESKLDLRKADVHNWYKKAVKDNLYVKFENTEAGVLSVSNWEEDCLTSSDLLDYRGSYDLNSFSFAKSYKLYVPDWNGKEIDMIWNGSADLKMYIADACEFYLQDDNQHVRDINRFEAGIDTVSLSVTKAQDWVSFADAGFVYVRFITSGNGLFRTKLKSDEDAAGLSDIMSSGLSVVAERGGMKLTAAVATTLSIYNMTGKKVADMALRAGEDRRVSLDSGIYIVNTGVGSCKVVVK